MDRCNLCDNQFLKYDAIDHMKQCQGRSLQRFRQLSKRLKTDIKLHCTPDHCFICGQQYLAKFFFDHMSEYHLESTYLVRRLMRNINISSDDTITYCIICGEEFLRSVMMNHLEKRHMENIPMILEISEQMIALDSERNCKICKTLYSVEEANNVTEQESQSLVLIHELRDRIKYLSNSSISGNRMTYSTVDSCIVCGKKFLVSEFVDHLVENHPETISLYQKLKEKTPHLSGESYCSMCGQHVLDSDPMDHFRKFHPHSMIMFRHIKERLEIKSESESSASTDENDYPSEVQQEVNKEIKKKNYVKHIFWIARKKNLSVIHKRALFYLKRAKFYKTRTMLYKKQSLNVSASINKNENEVKMEIEAIASDIDTLSKSIDLQPFVKLERLPPHIHQKYIETKNELQEVCGPYIHYLLSPQQNVSFIPISADTKEELNEAELYNSQNSEAYHLDVAVPGEISKKLIRQSISHSSIDNSNNLPKESISELLDDLCNLPKESISDTSYNLPKESISDSHGETCKQLKESPTSSSAEIFQCGVKEQNQNAIKGKKTLNAMKREAVIKINKKNLEKEALKEVFYWQKGLTKYVIKKRDTLAKLENNLINARKYAKGQVMKKKLLKEVNSIQNFKIRRKVIYFLEKLFVAMNKVPMKRKNAKKN